MNDLNITMNTFQNLYQDLGVAKKNTKAEMAVVDKSVKEGLDKIADLNSRTIELRKFQDTVGCKVLYICTLFIAKLIHNLIERNNKKELTLTGKTFNENSDRLEELASKILMIANQMQNTDIAIDKLKVEKHRRSAILGNLQIELRDITNQKRKLDQSLEATSKNSKPSKKFMKNYTSEVERLGRAEVAARVKADRMISGKEN